MDGERGRERERERERERDRERHWPSSKVGLLFGRISAKRMALRVKIASSRSFRRDASSGSGLGHFGHGRQRPQGASGQSDATSPVPSG